jgi:hypothetical protein
MQRTFELVYKKGKYGIMQNKTIEVVPFEHDTKAQAVAEWKYYQQMNTSNGRFLSYVLSEEEIERMAFDILDGEVVNVPVH